MTTTLEQTTAQPSTTFNILQKAVCVMLTCHFIGNHRKVDVDALVEAAGGTELTADPEQFTATKKLVDSAVLAPPMRVIGQTKLYLRRVSIPMHRVFGERSYLIPLPCVAEVDARMTQFEDELRAAAAKCAASYEAAKENARQALGPLFREDDYAPSWRVAEAFKIEWSYVSFSTPEKLETISSALAHKAHEKYERKLAEAFDEARGTLRQMALTVVKELVSKLSEDKSGKPKSVRGTTLDDLTDFLGRYQRMNVTGDSHLEAALTDLRRVSSGLTVQEVRDYEEVRAGLVRSATDAVQKLEVLVKSRAISLNGSL